MPSAGLSIYLLDTDDESNNESVLFVPTQRKTIEEHRNEHLTTTPPQNEEKSHRPTARLNTNLLDTDDKSTSFVKHLKAKLKKNLADQKKGCRKVLDIQYIP